MFGSPGTGAGFGAASAHASTDAPVFANPHHPAGASGAGGVGSGFSLLDFGGGKAKHHRVEWQPMGYIPTAYDQSAGGTAAAQQAPIDNLPTNAAQQAPKDNLPTKYAKARNLIHDADQQINNAHTQMTNAINIEEHAIEDQANRSIPMSRIAELYSKAVGQSDKAAKGFHEAVKTLDVAIMMLNTARMLEPQHIKRQFAKQLERETTSTAKGTSEENLKNKLIHTTTHNTTINTADRVAKERKQLAINLKKEAKTLKKFYEAAVIYIRAKEKVMQVENSELKLYDVVKIWFDAHHEFLNAANSFSDAATEYRDYAANARKAKDADKYRDNAADATRKAEAAKKNAQTCFIKVKETVEQFKRTEDSADPISKTTFEQIEADIAQNYLPAAMHANISPLNPHHITDHIRKFDLTLLEEEKSIPSSDLLIQAAQNIKDGTANLNTAFVSHAYAGDDEPSDDEPSDDEPSDIGIYKEIRIYKEAVRLCSEASKNYGEALRLISRFEGANESTLEQRSANIAKLEKAAAADAEAIARAEEAKNAAEAAARAKATAWEKAAKRAAKEAAQKAAKAADEAEAETYSLRLKMRVTRRARWLEKMATDLAKKAESFKIYYEARLIFTTANTKVNQVITRVETFNNEDTVSDDDIVSDKDIEILSSAATEYKKAYTILNQKSTIEELLEFAINMIEFAINMIEEIKVYLIVKKAYNAASAASAKGNEDRINIFKNAIKHCIEAIKKYAEIESKNTYFPRLPKLAERAKMLIINIETITGFKIASRDRIFNSRLPNTTISEKLSRLFKSRKQKFQLLAPAGNRNKLNHPRSKLTYIAPPNILVSDNSDSETGGAAEATRYQIEQQRTAAVAGVAGAGAAAPVAGAGAAAPVAGVAAAAPVAGAAAPVAGAAAPVAGVAAPVAGVAAPVAASAAGAATPGVVGASDSGISNFFRPATGWFKSWLGGNGGGRPVSGINVAIARAKKRNFIFREQDSGGVSDIRSSKSKFSRKHHHRLSGKNRKHTHKRFNKKQKTQKYKNNNRKRTQTRQ